MPIKKIIMSEEMLRKLEKPDNPVVIVGIPAGTEPSITGDYVLQEVSEKYPNVVLASTAGSTISFVAMEGKKERMRLKNVKFHLGLPPSFDFEWEKE